MTFSEWLKEQPKTPTTPKKLWRANKKDILSYWKNLRPDIPLAIQPLPYGQSGTTYGKDGIRITGSQQFITSVLPRLKEFLQFESPNSKLQVVYRQTDTSKTGDHSGNSFAFYIQVKERGQNNLQNNSTSV